MDSRGQWTLSAMHGMGCTERTRSATNECIQFMKPRCCGMSGCHVAWAGLGQGRALMSLVVQLLSLIVACPTHRITPDTHCGLLHTPLTTQTGRAGGILPLQFGSWASVSPLQSLSSPSVHDVSAAWGTRHRRYIHS